MPTAAESLRVVLDTNVLVSGLNYAGTPSRLLRLLLQGEMDWFVSPFILQELHRILAEKFRWEEERAQRALRLIREVATEVDPPRSVSVIREKDDDNRILECALHAKAHYLVSGDRRHLLPLREFQGVSIVRPAEFLELVLRNRAGHNETNTCCEPQRIPSATKRSFVASSRESECWASTAPLPVALLS